ncbi:MAG: CapA family protein [Cyanobacteria bacterium P01_B01_bin.77]
MIKSVLVNAARQGDVDAITTLLRQVLGMDNALRVTVRQIARSLKITLEGPSAPEKAQYAQTVYATLVCLSLPHIERIQVHGKAINADVAAWVQRWEADTGYGLIHLSNQLAKRPQKKPWYTVLTRWPDQFLAAVTYWATPLWGRAIAFQETVTQGIVSLQSPQLSTWATSVSNFPAIQQVSRRVLPKTKEAGAVTIGLLLVTSFGIGYTLEQLADSTSDRQPSGFAEPGFEGLPELEPSADNDRVAISTLNLSARELLATDLETAINIATQPPPAPTPAVVIKAVGDIIPGTNYPYYRLPQDANVLFQRIVPYLQKENDILFGNYESTLTDHPYSAKDISRSNTFAFRSPPAYAQIIRQAGFDMMSVANNHSFDFGPKGFEDTMAHLNAAGVKTVGQKGEISYIDVNDMTVAFIAFSYFPDHNLMHDLTAADSLIKQAEQQADMVVISVHAGAEGTMALNTYNKTEYFLGENRGNMVQFSRGVIDSGADLVLGHGPHVPRAIELYKDRLIAYSLGNFLGYDTLPVDGALGQSMILQVGLEQDGSFFNGSVIPVLLDRDGLPYLDNSFQTVALLRKLIEKNFPNTPLAIDGDGHIVRTDEQ